MAPSLPVDSIVPSVAPISTQEPDVAPVNPVVPSQAPIVPQVALTPLPAIQVASGLPVIRSISSVASVPIATQETVGSMEANR